MISLFHQLCILFVVGALLFIGSGPAAWQVAFSSADASVDTAFFENHPPNPPRLPIPENGSVEQLITVNMQWRGGDPDGDIVLYDVYFEADDPTPDTLVSYHQQKSYYDPGLLSYDTTYYWQIIAIDPYHSQTVGPIWRFQTQSQPVPNLECDGTLIWTRVPAASTQTGSFLVRNLGDPQSLLFWEIASYPTWGNWNLTPLSDNNLTPEMGAHTVTVSVVVPDSPFQEFSGEVRVVNQQNRSDYDVVRVSVSTAQNMPSWSTTHILFSEIIPNSNLQHISKTVKLRSE